MISHQYLNPQKATYPPSCCIGHIVAVFQIVAALAGDQGIVEHLIQQEGVTEELKRQDQMEWVRRMESIQNRAREVVMAEVICQ